ncbi:T-cell surface glycoprotein CD1e, membrane-associated-like [Lepus europaeus]|uniref:T-cell surface glycoprotein CD1e, membrane-associated-like n=1 Tax=Lepus europaeus TaxID=9983 RepID=UPI002B48062B|nr:T-cell surface glycoprotein CD1e, membrane-associated-like [Lepus europaeus]
MGISFRLSDNQLSHCCLLSTTDYGDFPVDYTATRRCLVSFDNNFGTVEMRGGEEDKSTERMQKTSESSKNKLKGIVKGAYRNIKEDQEVGFRKVRQRAGSEALRLHYAPAEEPLTFRVIQISSFANQSWARNQGSGWLGDIQTHGLDSVSGTILFLKPWSHGNFSKEELSDIQALLQFYLHGFIRVVQAFASQFQFEYPFVIQISAGCAVHAGAGSESFLYGAYQGSDFLRFQGGSWQPSPGAGTRAQMVCRLLNEYRGIREMAQILLNDTLPRFTGGLLAKGKSELERQVKPEAWLSSGPSPGPGRLLLVCRVSGFYPKPVWVMWMRGDKQQSRTRRGDVLPNADGTWYLRVTLDVAAGAAAGLSCRVKHSSLRGHDIIVPWGGHSILLWLICLTVIVTLFMLAVAESWFPKQSSNANICVIELPSDYNTEEPRIFKQQLCLAQELGIKQRFLQEWKTILNKIRSH